MSTESLRVLLHNPEARGEIFTAVMVVFGVVLAVLL